MSLSKKATFALGNFFGASVVGFIVVACSGDGGSSVSIGSGSGSAGSDPGTIAASNVILNVAQTARSADGFIRVQANQLPSDVKVLASNVSLVQASNDLQSRDLQTALDTELAVDVKKSIVGTWSITNLTTDQIYKGAAAAGEVEIKADGTYVLRSGGFAAAGKTAPGVNNFCAIPTVSTWQEIDGVIYLGADAGGDSVAQISSAKKDSITLVGDGGCGAQGVARISKLTRVGVKPVALDSPAQAGKSLMQRVSF